MRKKGLSATQVEKWCCQMQPLHMTVQMAMQFSQPNLKDFEDRFVTEYTILSNRIVRIKVLGISTINRAIRVA